MIELQSHRKIGSDWYIIIHFLCFYRSLQSRTHENPTVFLKIRWTNESEGVIFSIIWFGITDCTPLAVSNSTALTQKLRQNVNKSIDFREFQNTSTKSKDLLKTWSKHYQNFLLAFICVKFIMFHNSWLSWIIMIIDDTFSTIMLWILNSC